MRVSYKRFLQAVVGLGLIAVVLSAWTWPWSTSYEAPPKTATAVEIPSRPSSVVLPIVATIAEIQARLEKQIPTELYTVDENRDACVPAKWAKYCLIPRPWGGCAQEAKTQITPAIDCHLEGWVRRGSITIGGSAQTLTATMPVNLSVTARGRGEIGKHIQETATGAADVFASATVDIDENWKPSASVKADYHWNDKIGVNILGFRVTFASKVDPQIRKAIDSFERSIPSKLEDLKIKETAAESWSKGFATFQANENPSVWVRFAPSSVGYGGYDIAEGEIRTKLMLMGNVDTFVGGKPDDIKPTPLPSLVRNVPDPGFHLFLPVLLEYGAMRDAARKLLDVGTAKKIQVPEVGSVSVTFKDIEFYQTTDNALAVGVTLSADPEGSWFDTNGTVWLTTKLAVDDKAKKVTANSLGIFGKTDNNAADLLISIVQFGPIKEALQSAASFDYSKQYDDGLAKLNAAMRRQISPDLYFDGRVDGVSVESVSAGPEAIYVGFLTAGRGAVHLGKLPSQ